MPRSVDELESLHDEFNLADSAAAEFHVTLKRFVTDDIAFDSAFDAGDFVQQVRRGASRINKRLMLPEKFVGQLAVAGHAARLDQSQAFPGLTESPIIMGHA